VYQKEWRQDNESIQNIQMEARVASSSAISRFLSRKQDRSASRWLPMAYFESGQKAAAMLGKIQACLTYRTYLKIRDIMVSAAFIQV
jgi:hypothetical protein